MIVSYHWPPAGGVTALRSLRFATRLRAHGWEPVIACATDDSYENQDPKLLSLVPPNMEVLRIPAWRPHGLYRRFVGAGNAEEAIVSHKKGWRHKLALWVRANLFFPDAKMFWIGPAVRGLEAYLRKNPVHAVFTSGPPHTNTEVARRLKERLGICWLADFQDPWSELGYFHRLPLTRIARFRHRQLEGLALRAADSVTAASPRWAEDLALRSAREVTFLPWGFEEREFIGETEAIPPAPLRLCHIGTMGTDRDPAPLIAALAKFSQPWRLDLVGSFEADRELASIPRVHIHGFLPRDETLALLRNCHVAVVVLNRLPRQKGRIPAKLYEALRSEKPILAIGDPDGDAAELIARFGAGITVPPEDGPGLRQALEALAGRGRGADASQLGSLEMSNLTGRLADELTRITAGT